jgi:hypothetical protein
MRRMTLPILLAASLIAFPTASLDQLWSYITLVWTADLTNEGCGLDPNGACQPTPSTDAGCGLDPYGRPLCPPGS